MADLTKTINELNRVYAALKQHAVRIVETLKLLEADADWGWYAGHSIERNGELVYEEYPIPVITVKDVCEIGIDIKAAFVEGKLFISDACYADFSELNGFDFCVYGAENYLCDIFDSRHDDPRDLKAALLSSGENEICIDIEFDNTPDAAELIHACAVFKRLGAHILPVQQDAEGSLDTNE